MPDGAGPGTGGRGTEPTALRYDNRTGRGPSAVVRAATALLPGVARVWGQVEPYADAWHAHNLVALERPGRRWIVLGDSLSQGIGASTYDGGWVGQLHRRLSSGGLELQVINLSATGARTEDVLLQQLPALAGLAVRDDDVVTVLVGSNDMMGGRARRLQLPSAYAELVDAVPRGSIVATMPQPRGTAARATAHVVRASAERRIVMLDLRVTGAAFWRGRLAADHVHPNDAGHTAIADIVEPAITRAIGA